jgi:hypothetical protein
MRGARIGVNESVGPPWVGDAVARPDARPERNGNEDGDEDEDGSWPTCRKTAIS